MTEQAIRHHLRQAAPGAIPPILADALNFEQILPSGRTINAGTAFQMGLAVLRKLEATGLNALQLIAYNGREVLIAYAALISSGEAEKAQRLADDVYDLLLAWFLTIYELKGKTVVWYLSRIPRLRDPWKPWRENNWAQFRKDHSYISWKA